MEKISINNVQDPLYPLFQLLYRNSFPLFEQRTPDQQAKAFSSPRYHLSAYCEKGRFIGFIACWEFPEYVYIEHFAVDPTLRGKGYGTQILDRFLAETPQMVMLEIDPLIDETSRARFRFYQKCGFYANPYPHIHPPYRKEYAGHALIVLSTRRPLAEEEYRQFQKDLTRQVMEE